MDTALIHATALLVALAVDRWLGEPPVRLHPVVWIGNYLGGVGAWVQRHTLQQPGGKDLKAFWLAALVWMVGAALVSGVAWGLPSLLFGLPWWAAGALLGLLLKPLLAWAMLQREVLAVEAALGQSLDAGRERLRWLVSRDVSQLTEAQVRESAIETLAENLNDSVVAPIFWFVLLGLPGAALYRFANTADAMWGYPGLYKGQNWAWAGKWAARVDDGLNYLPARLTGLLLAGLNGVGWGRLTREAIKTPSPNSGWPMAAMALALGVRLGKPGGYVLHESGRKPVAADLHLAIVYAKKVLLAQVLIMLIAIVLIAKIGS
ncbi:adenosylcobinamide-phosphate synthase CbiB [Rhodoferax sp.]|uniref:adenosylcobinamide-phosphate synthase CbiB n=1 Tax=Rhodoferax sp. TaxID=50421 RepID=UPI002616D37C|nr:adenosylcobinamide-phosphate synthase CbiB [Rhodoferax sp.]MDD2926191.1 adenosylcobinamide-phosphate synthase CbiB [Rhodoferax sp.]